MEKATFDIRLTLPEKLVFETRGLPFEVWFAEFDENTLADLLKLGITTKLSQAANNFEKLKNDWNEAPENAFKQMTKEEAIAILMEKQKQLLIDGKWSYEKQAALDELDSYRVKAVRIYMKGNEQVKAEFKKIPSKDQKDRETFLLNLAYKSDSNFNYFTKQASELLEIDRANAARLKELEAIEMPELDLDF